MEASASALVDSKHDTSKDEEDVAKQLFSFKSLHVHDSATKDEISTPDTSLKQKGTDEFQVPSIVYQEKNPTTSKKLSNKFDEKDSSFQVSNGPPIDEDDLLPSQVTDRQYIYLEDDGNHAEDYMKEGGKWMIFTHGDMQKQDQYWTSLKILYHSGTLVSLKASTAFESEHVSNARSGVINCYTAEADNWAEVKKAAQAIRDVIDYEFIMYYKTNEASAQGQYISTGSRLISRYMFTIKGGFYEKDKYNRWEWL